MILIPFGNFSIYFMNSFFIPEYLWYGQILLKYYCIRYFSAYCDMVRCKLLGIYIEKSMEYDYLTLFLFSCCVSLNLYILLSF